MCAGMVDVTGSGIRCPIKEGETVRGFSEPAEKSQASTVKKAGGLAGRWVPEAASRPHLS